MFPPLRQSPRQLPQLSGLVPAALNFLTAHCGLLTCGLFLLAGLVLADDYGVYYDENGQRDIAQANLNYILGQSDRIYAGHHHNRVYGISFELPLLLAEQGLGLANRYAIHRLRTTLTHLFFIVSAYFCYRLACHIFNNRLLALVALLFFLLHPRIYAHSYLNSKDLPFLSMLMIALYLLERAFRRDTLGGFVLLGIGVGLATNMRIMGIMLLPAALAMQGLDLFQAGNGPQRRGILLRAGLFILAVGMTLYVLSPYAWTNPVDYLRVALAITVAHPTVLEHLFRGEVGLVHELPQYTAVWAAITTPPLLLLLGGLGIAAVLGRGLARPGAVFGNTRLRFLFLLLACWLLPPLAASLLGSVQNENWRHLYYIYPPFALLAAGGLGWLGSLAPPPHRLLRSGAYGLAGAGVGLIAFQMAQIHPHQDIYFNFLVDRTTPEYLRSQYRMMTPNVQVETALKYLRERHPGETLALRSGIRTPLRTGLGRSGRTGFLAGQDFAEADYLIYYVRYHGDQDLAFNSLPAGRIYNNTVLAVKPLNDSRMTAAALAAYREIYRQAVAGEPIIRADYDVYLQDQTLTFIRENCVMGDRERQVKVKVLRPAVTVSTGQPITLRSHGVRYDDTCLAVLRLPDYAQGDLIIGAEQGSYQWEALHSRSQPGLRGRIAAARRENPRPTRPEAFEVFREQTADGRNWLLYFKPHCSDADYGIRIALHLYPEQVEDLPAYSRSRGYGIWDFRLWHYGARSDGACLVDFPLPDWPIKEIRTGQPGRWSQVLYAPADPEPLRAAYAALTAVEPDLRDAFDLYWQEGKLTYVRESCAAADTAARFRLHIIPEDLADLPVDLPAAGPGAGYANLDFDFGRWGGHFDGKCLATVPLPDYPIAALRTGQAEVWKVNLYPPADPEQLRAAYTALSTREPDASSAFALYLEDNQLTYRRENCTATDTAAEFFLHIVPEDVTDLPEERRPAGFAQQSFDFARWGGQFDGKCLAMVPLPDYPLRAIRAGQYVPGQGDLWSTQLIVPANPDELRAEYAALSGIDPAARDDFNLYAYDNRVIYLRESCAEEDTAARLFLHIVPENPADLPPGRRSEGYANQDFDFAWQGGHFDGKCLAAVSLPDYPIKEIRTGQYVPGQSNLWSVELIAAPDAAKLQAEYAALSEVQPAARAAFALYWQGNQLLYLRESCAVDDTAADFFLHIVPADLTDLPAERQDAGFAHGGFSFAHQGGIFDGKCLASVSLPDYPIASLRTGQYVPGQGELWSVELRGLP